MNQQKIQKKLTQKYTRIIFILNCTYMPSFNVQREQSCQQNYCYHLPTWLNLYLIYSEERCSTYNETKLTTFSVILIEIVLEISNHLQQLTVTQYVVLINKI